MGWVSTDSSIGCPLNNRMKNKFNTLVISDLHLGEDLSPKATPATSQHLALLERQLSDFLRYYAKRRRDGLPWRLLINGDMVDFLQICLPADHAHVQALYQGATRDEELYGLSRREEVACAQIAAVIERHDSVFRELARFLSRGNVVDIVCGNHDMEFHWASVQDTFRREVARIWKGLPEARVNEAMQERITSGISFHPWFFYEKDVMWVEHGHQYDDCCSFEHLLAPTAPGGEHIAPNVDTAGLRYVTNQIEEAEPHAQVEWSMFGHIRFALGLGLRGIVRFTHCYYLFVMCVLAVWRGYRPWSAPNRARRKAHRGIRDSLAQKWSLEREQLRKVDDLRRHPVVTSLRRLASVLMLDSVVLYSSVFLATLVSLVLLPFLWTLLLSTTAFALAAVFNRTVLNASRNVDPEVAMLLMPDRIRRHIDVPIVMFGHSHEPVVRPLDGDGTYFNSGTWMPTGKPGLLRSFTHVVVTHTERGPIASLRQWRDGASRDFTPGWVATQLGDQAVSSDRVKDAVAA